MRFLAGLLVLSMMPQQAAACPSLTPAGQRAEQKRQERWLHKESNKMVSGTWTQVRIEEGDDGWLKVYGLITSPRKHGVPQTYETLHFDEINCGFPSFPENGQIGKFYLERDGMSPDRLVHFVPAPSSR